MFKLYNTWRRAKDMFVKPSLKVYFGKWVNDPNLPVWRRGASIHLVRRGRLLSKAYSVKDRELIHTGMVKHKDYFGEMEIPKYEWSVHDLPGKLRAGDYVWNRNIRKKLKKWHLGWIPPIIKLPIWTMFHIVNIDVMWKYKWDDIRYEFPPQFTIIAFGLSLSFTLHCPIYNEYASDYNYWEGMLNYLNSKTHDLKEAIDLCGVWRRLGNPEETSYFALRPEYIIPSRREEYYAAVSELKRLGKYEESHKLI